MFKNMDETSKSLICIAAVLSVIFALLGAVIINDNAPYAQDYDFIALVGGKLQHLAGVAIGFLCAAIKGVLIDKSCKKAVDMESGGARLYATGQYFLRLVLTGGVLIAAIFVPWLGFLGTALGVLSLQFAGYLHPFVQKRRGIE